ncbi:MAG: hypothetical protein NZ889_02270, partial [Candidatus Pacearchaeota archaeon]|nr:hypothetical protein [Candidatus Pacearchaeota archaeon]
CFKIPIVTVDGFARKEIVENEKNGFVIKRPKIVWKKEKIIIEDRKKLIRDLIDATKVLIENKETRKKMGNYGFKLVAQGKFSIRKRNKKLRKIYEESLK